MTQAPAPAFELPSLFAFDSAPAADDEAEETAQTKRSPTRRSGKTATKKPAPKPTPPKKTDPYGRR